MLPSSSMRHRVYVHVEVATLKIQYRNVLGLQVRFSVSDLHSNAVEQVVAVGLHYQLAVWACYLAKVGFPMRPGRWGGDAPPAVAAGTASGASGRSSSVMTGRTWLTPYPTSMRLRLRTFAACYRTSAPVPETVRFHSCRIA